MKIERVIRDAAFAERLSQACDAFTHVPPKNSGRLTWIKRELFKRFKIRVSVETVRKWFSGEAKPRPEKLNRIAQLLEVDVAWLSLGVHQDSVGRERRARNAVANGAVNLVAGLIQLDGGHPAFPEADSKDLKRAHVDLHAIIKGAQYDIHVSLGEPEGRTVRFLVPPKTNEMLVLGVVRRGLSFDIFEITPDMISKGTSTAGAIEVPVSDSEIKKRRIESFANRI